MKISRYNLVIFRLLDFCTCHISCVQRSTLLFSPWCFCEERGAKCVCLLMMVSRWCLKVRAATKLLGNCVCVCVPSLDSLWLLNISTKFRKSLHNIILGRLKDLCYPYCQSVINFSDNHPKLTHCVLMPIKSSEKALVIGVLSVYCGSLRNFDNSFSVLPPLSALKK